MLGYRETFSDSKKILNKYSIGLAHQKVIHLLSMYEGISISELLAKDLKVTKQSLNRVLKDLIKLEAYLFLKKMSKIQELNMFFLMKKEKKFLMKFLRFKKKEFIKLYLTLAQKR